MSTWFILPFDFDSILRTLSILSANETVKLSFRCSLIANIVFWIASTFGLLVDQLVHKANRVAVRSRSPWKSKKEDTAIDHEWNRLSNYFKSCKNQPNSFILGKDRVDLVRLAFLNMAVMAFFVCSPLFGYVWDLIKMKRTLHSHQYEDYAVIWKREIFAKLPIHALVADCTFYAFHCFLHWSPLLYKHIHKTHHRFTAPTAMTCVYAHPFEFVFGNVLPIYLGPILCDSYPITCYLWWGLAMLGTCKGQSDYRIMGHRDDHEDHHLLYRYYFGGMGVLDRILGTIPATPTSPKTDIFQETPNKTG